jgi:hypothetical protein
LFLECSQSFFHSADDDAAEADFPEEELEKILQAFVVVDNENGWLAGFFLLENVLIEGGFFDAPATANLNGWELAALDEIINGRQWDAEVFGRFLDR